MKKFVQIGCRNICYMLAMFLLQSAVFADVNAAFFQDRMVSGNVTSSDDGEGIPGVNILVKGTTIGTVTDVDGNYIISIPGGSEATLVYSAIGFVSQERAVGGQSVINLQLLEDTKSLDEVVVVGYGTQKKVNLTGAVGVIGADQLENRSVASVTEALQGQVAGLQIVRTGGQPGNQAINIKIRGTSTFDLL